MAHPSRRTALAGLASGLLLPRAARAAGDAPITSRIVVEDNRLWLAASFNGGPPRLFVVDTGAPHNFLRPEIAAQLRLTTIGNESYGGLGKDQVTTAVVVARDLLLGGTIRVPQTAFTLYDFGGGIPADAAGLIAAGIFTGRDSDIDFEAGAWRLWPRGRPARPDLTLLPSHFGEEDARRRYSPKLEVTAFLDGKPYRLVCDTGAPGGVLLNPNAARANRLFDDGRPFAIEQTSGFGGRAAKLSRVMRMERLQLGPLTVERPLVTVMDPDQRSISEEYDGLIGLSLLQLLTLATDIRARKLYASRNGRTPPPERYRLAGLWLERTTDGGAAVALVGTGSPAAAAGVRAGDKVVEPARFEVAIEAIGGRAGKAVTLNLGRDGVTRKVGYTLAPYL